MAHYAKLGINSKVIAVHVVSDSDCLNASGVEDEEVGRQFWKESITGHFGKKHLTIHLAEHTKMAEHL
jgi:hypothetical protein